MSFELLLVLLPQRPPLDELEGEVMRLLKVHRRRYVSAIVGGFEKEGEHLANSVLPLKDYPVKDLPPRAWVDLEGGWRDERAAGEALLRALDRKAKMARNRKRIDLSVELTNILYDIGNKSREVIIRLAPRSRYPKQSKEWLLKKHWINLSAKAGLQVYWIIFWHEHRDEDKIADLGPMYAHDSKLAKQAEELFFKELKKSGYDKLLAEAESIKEEYWSLARPAREAYINALLDVQRMNPKAIAVKVAFST